MISHLMSGGIRSARHYGLAVLLALGLAVASGQSTAWADSTDTESSGGSLTSSSAATDTSAGGAGARPSDSSSRGASDATKSATDDANTAAGAKGTAASARDASPTRFTSPTKPKDGSTVGADRASGRDTATSSLAEEDSAPSTQTGTQGAAASPLEPPEPLRQVTTTRGALLSTSIASLPDTTAAPKAVALDTPAAPAPATWRTALVVTTPQPPGPVAPIADIVELPGRIVNAFLQLVGVTTAAGTPPSPISPAPIAELVFAVFRRLESDLGLDAPVTGMPVPPSLVYTGPLTRPTPTVEQFLNAATTSYVLGATPGGMRPFTVDGWPMASTDTFTGMSAKVWVTPQSQLIIAYSGTTGGTNLLFNPWIALSQILTDAEAGFSNTTPDAFTQAVRFAERVQTEAAAQGYTADDIFVTGHSLGGWEAQYVAQQLGFAGIGFEGPGLSSTVPGNGVDALFVNTASYGDIAAYLASDLPGLQPFAPPYVPAGGLKPHYGPIVLLGDPDANNPMINASRLWGTSVVGSLIAVVDLFGNFFANHLPAVQAYNLDVDLDPSVVPWLGQPNGPVLVGFGELTIPEFLKAASDAGILVRP